MRYFPIFMDLRDQIVVLVGAGGVAERKARQLIECGALVRVVAGELNRQFESWKSSGAVVHLAEEYSDQVLQGARLVFAATSDDALNRQVFGDAERRSIPANVVDDKRLCRFISPAVVDRSPIQVAISTGGSSPVLARRIRAWIEELLPMGIGQVAQAAGDVRRLVKKLIPREQRRTLWERLMGDGQVRAWSLLNTSEVKQQLQREIRNSILNSEAVEARPGKVFLVGAGPGRADLLTLRALHVMGQADVILHDRLVSEEVLGLARRDADRIDVGKRAGKRHASHEHREQQDINDLMLREVAKGRTVVRLKGGDSFVFGRGGEELEFLHAHGIAYEVVPGITAALGCAAYAGIPLTHRDHAHTLTFVTGHFSAQEQAGARTSIGGVDWAAIAGAGKTAAVYMGVRQAKSLCADLLRSGVDAELPVAVVVNGSLESQKVLHGTIRTLHQLSAQVGDDAPGLLIIGQVAALGSTLAWFGRSAALKSAA